MKVRSRFCLILAFILPLLLLTSKARAIPHLSAGQPGCLYFIIDQPVDDKKAARLTQNCKELRAAYLDSLKVYSSSPAKFQKEIDLALKSKNSSGPAYRAILLAALYQDSHFVPALEARAKVETTKKAKDRFASAALERIQKGGCSSLYKDKHYDEICRLGSPVVSRVIELTRERAR